jgi:oligosaccharyltransferase complex subunit alpha (ribophorin I)
MRLTHLLLSCLAALSRASDVNISEPQLSRIILPTEFKPPAVFENVNLVRNINLEKSYPRETINVVIKNVDKEQQSEYYLPFEADMLSRLGGLEVRDRKDTKSPPFKADITAFGEERYTKATNLNSLVADLISD